MDVGCSNLGTSCIRNSIDIVTCTSYVSHCSAARTFLSLPLVQWNVLMGPMAAVGHKVCHMLTPLLGAAKFAAPLPEL
eukprot:6485794-Amphidinium_carterae.1